MALSWTHHATQSRLHGPLLRLLERPIDLLIEQRRRADDLADRRDIVSMLLQAPWVDRKPATYEWLPFGGGIRRCLGASLAMAEQRVVLGTMARRLDITCDDPTPEPALHRNVTMIPRRGAQIMVRARR